MTNKLERGLGVDPASASADAFINELVNSIPDFESILSEESLASAALTQFYALLASPALCKSLLLFSSANRIFLALAPKILRASLTLKSVVSEQFFFVENSR